MTDHQGEYWLFAYGSLIWDPGFDFEERQHAVLRGYHRSFCILSHVYRGTPESPGLVLGLKPGGRCQGIAYRVAADHHRAVSRCVWEREMVTRVYREAVLTVELTTNTIQANCFVVDPDHPQYAGALDPEEAARLIRQGVGRAGRCRDYLANTISHLDSVGVTDPQLRELLVRVDSERGG